MRYYTSITILIWLALCILCILVRENARLRSEKKTVFYLTYLLIALAALSEWLGLKLSGSAAPQWLLRFVKCADYILTPLSGGIIVAHLRNKKTWWRVILFRVLILNTVFQLVAFFTGWMTTVDAHNRYAHGPLYFVYIIVYLIVAALVVTEFVVYGRQFRRQNQKSLYAILLLVIAGIALQEIMGGEIRCAYLALTLGASLLFIHETEFSQQAADSHLHEQHIQITTDALTGVYSRYAYSKALKQFDSTGAPPSDLAVFSIDINGLKTVNDTLGHDAGDELICGAADCITAAFGKTGKCYRTGGDEFVVLANMEMNQTTEAMARLTWQTARWHGEAVSALRLAVGCATAAEHPGLSAEKLVGVADRAMYAEKSAYYRNAGIDRRRTVQTV